MVLRVVLERGISFHASSILPCPVVAQHVLVIIIVIAIVCGAQGRYSMYRAQDRYSMYRAQGRYSMYRAQDRYSTYRAQDRYSTYRAQGRYSMYRVDTACIGHRVDTACIVIIEVLFFSIDPWNILYILNSPDWCWIIDCFLWDAYTQHTHNTHTFFLVFLRAELDVLAHR